MPRCRCLGLLAKDRQYLDDGQLDNPYSGRVSSGNYTEVVTTKDACSVGIACIYRLSKRGCPPILVPKQRAEGSSSRSNQCPEPHETQEFIPDGDLLPLPHTRTQLCHYALRLTQPVQLGMLISKTCFVLVDEERAEFCGLEPL